MTTDRTRRSEGSASPEGAGPSEASPIDLDELDRASAAARAYNRVGPFVLGGVPEGQVALTPDQADAISAELREARALLVEALMVAGNAAAHWHAIAGVTLKPDECPGCTAEEHSKAALDRIRAHLAKHTADQDGRRDLGQAELGRTGGNDAAGQPKESS